MEWVVLLDPEFEEWLLNQTEDVQNAIAAHAQLLRRFGPSLGRPKVDTLKHSSMPNLKELRVQHLGKPWRILFVFDPRRQAILLVGGNKQSDKRWYQKNILIAEKRYQRYLEELERENV